MKVDISTDTPKKNKYCNEVLLLFYITPLQTYSLECIWANLFLCTSSNYSIGNDRP